MLYFCTFCLSFSSAMQRSDFSFKRIDRLLKPAGLGNALNSIASGKFIYMESARWNGRADLRKGKRADPTAIHRIIVGVKHRNLDQLKEILFDISDPHSANYGHHLSNTEVQEMTTNAESCDYVVQFLRFHGISVSDKSVHGGQYIEVEATISEWEQLFNTEFYEIEHIEKSDRKFLRALHYSLPELLSAHVGVVFNTVQLPDPNYFQNKKRVRATPLSDLSVSSWSGADSLSGYVTPSLLNSVYGITNNGGSSSASQGVFESIDQSMSPSDLAYFQTYFNLPVEPVAYNIGGHSSNTACKANYGNDCAEANLDVQWMMAVAQHTPTTYYYYDNDDFMLGWILEVAKTTRPVLVYSISYGLDEVYLPDSYGSEFDVQAIKLGVQGVTIVASSGDDGAISANGRDSYLYCGYMPSFPASSPYVVAVGGTMGPERNLPEVACQGDLGGVITTGGGFSTYADMPSYQAEAVNGYLSSVAGTPKEPSRGFNRAGRGYPDISALAYNYVVAIDKKFYGVSGTSASSPVFAGMVSLVNSARIAAGKSAVGWINPALYMYSSLFVRDVTVGDNFCVASGLVCCEQGYYATTGWDPVTGLGSVDFPSFMSTFMSMENNYMHPSMKPTVFGEKSASPSKAPVLPPALSPTASPSMSAGWMQISVYEEAHCEMGEDKTGNRIATSISALPTGVCLVEYDTDHKTVLGSRKYFCEEGIYSSARAQFHTPLFDYFYIF